MPTVDFESYWSVLQEAAIKSIALLMIALVVTLALRKSSAALRHLVWLLALSGAMALPALSARMPQWGVLPAWRSGAAVAEPVQVMVRRDEYADEQPMSITAPPTESTAVVAETSRPWSWEAILLSIWAAGAVVMVTPMLAGALILRRLGRRAHAAPEAEAMLAELGVTRRVTVLQTPERMIPMTWGVFRPKILLPAEAAEWADQRLRIVLLHELAHIKRHDVAAQWVALLARAIYWFNPLAWIAARRMAVERERACDDLVLAHGARASDYAEELLGVATGLHASMLACAAGMAMARSSELAGRLKCILNGGQNRRSATRRVIAFGVIVLAAGLLPLAALRQRAAAQTPLVAPAPATQPLAAKGTDQAVLDTVLPEVSFHNAPLTQIVDDLRQMTGANIVLEAGVLEAAGVNPRTPVNLQLHNVPLSKMLSTVLTLAGGGTELSYAYDRGVITISTEEQISKEMSAAHASYEKTDRQTPSLMMADDDLVRQLEGQRTGMLEQLSAMNAAMQANIAQPSSAAPWKANLDNGITVELLGVCEHTSVNRHWWKPDGSARTFAFTPPTLGKDIGTTRVGNEMMVQVTNRDGDDNSIDVAWKFQAHSGWKVTPFATAGTRGASPVMALGAALFPADAARADVQVGVAAGSWQPAGVHGNLGVEEDVTNMSRDNPGEVVMIPVVALGGNEGVAAVAAYTIHNVQARLVAVMRDGKEKYADESENGGSSGLHELSAKFRGVDVKDVAQFVLEVRPYQWAEFRNVALKPQ